jgi:selenide,water dikinase
VISTAIKKGTAKAEWIEAATRSMTTLNAKAAAAIASKDFGVHALTDVTGFGLIGHAREMALGSGVSLEIGAAHVPLLAGALECVRAGFVPGGLNANREFAECVVEFAEGLAPELRTILFDPQTAGGLLISVSFAHADELRRAIEQAGVAVSRIGSVVASRKPLIRVI